MKMGNRAMRLKKRGKSGIAGFTIPELMIVLVIVAVLAAVALPAYQGYVVKANRGAAQAYLMEIAQKQQLYFNDTRTYASDPNDLNVEAPPRVASNYTVSIAADPNDVPPTYTVTATATGRQASDGNLVIDHTGSKTRAGTEAW